MSKPVLPQDIMLLICEELGLRRQFGTLFNCSLVNHRTASIAVEQLYGILEVMDPFIFYTNQSIRLWRAIILSSLGATRFPYCAYMRALSLGSLVECLDDIRSDAAARQCFFEGPMQDFLVLQRGYESVKTTRKRLPPLDNPAITSKCAESIIQYAKQLADGDSTTMALTHLEASVFPRDILPTWLSCLGSLTSLQIQDGSVLGVEAAGAITAHCPNFSELTCFHCSSDTAAEDVAAFFLALRPNTLQRFEILSRNNLSGATLAALRTHAKSLRVLDLRSLPASTTKRIHILSECTALERLVIEKDTTDGSDLDIMTVTEMVQVAEWLRSCKALRELGLHHVRDALPILHHVLPTPEIRLETLHIQDWHFASEEVTKATWEALGHQKRLKLLAIASQDQSTNDLVLSQNPELTDSICHLYTLTSLNLMQTYVSSDEISRIATALPGIEELSFGGELIDDSILEPLSKLSKLATLTVTAVTAFTFDNLLRFAERLYDVGNQGIKVELLNQWHEAKLTTDEEMRLNMYFADHLKGQIAISYPNDPDELHEADFSDSD
ncbi:hypothetical protein F5B22DRAFT_290920 [Xylaria bambusicola]|uniref:uncharacterized protein n=1 Tax=Xylaria bambusicola TaxID=326684 RepID=UPI0020077054|nr:uncharacterized protein F5B22DRAFT_290920 [Xylaria bambusicola]KAI0512726.1 hypothetical protein F5B22DRAFT_290920 [Xylaria bambusicola]